ncbi:hypothetical protein Bbelb_080920 [Branchiostoma belcheri]|nr:hypothetical protein Bbelb_080920 [Branchiostoma belcheri]
MSALKLVLLVLVLAAVVGNQGGKAADVGGRTVGEARQASDKTRALVSESDPTALERVKLQRRGLRSWFCEKLSDKKRPPSGKRGVKDKMWQTFCAPDVAAAM